MKPHKEQPLRCAIYTRKSSEEGLERWDSGPGSR